MLSESDVVEIVVCVASAKYNSALLLLCLVSPSSLGPRPTLSPVSYLIINNPHIRFESGPGFRRPPV